jgi:RNA ligase (TIGR02306 family)
MRKLASIQKILKVEPLPNSDYLDVCQVLGWQCITKRNDFHAGDYCVYFETDSWLPERPEFDFLRKNCWKENENGKGFRIRIIKLRKQISQGLIMPLSILPCQILNLEEGMDVTDMLEVKLYNPPIPACLRGKIKGSFPSFLCKTDETRVQILQDVLTRYKGIECAITEKIDGSSVTYYIRDGVFGICSRNVEFQLDSENLYCKMAEKLKIEEKLRAIGYNIAIQGELCGVGIQGNRLQLQENKVFFFNVFLIDKYSYISHGLAVQMLINLGLETVPFIGYDELSDDIEWWVKFATRKSLLNPKKWAEGVVIRPTEEKIDMQMASGFGNGRVSFKSINPEYLLEGD